MKLADQATAMLPLTPTGAAGAVVIRAPLITVVLREYFELLWDRATPLKPAQPAAQSSASLCPPTNRRRGTPRRDRGLRLRTLCEQGATDSQVDSQHPAAGRHSRARGCTRSAGRGLYRAWQAGCLACMACKLQSRPRSIRKLRAACVVHAPSGFAVMPAR